MHCHCGRCSDEPPPVESAHVSTRALNHLVFDFTRPVGAFEAFLKSARHSLKISEGRMEPQGLYDPFFLYTELARQLQRHVGGRSVTVDLDSMDGPVTLTRATKNSTAVARDGHVELKRHEEVLEELRAGSFYGLSHSLHLLSQVNLR